MPNNWDGNRKRSSDVESPWYVTAIVKVGVPSAIALFLIWFLTAEVKSDIAVIRESVKIHAEATIHSADTIRQQNDKLIYMLQRICVNAAKNETDRTACLGR